ncbi:SRPBCC family protein [Lentimicrobium sp. S6]|uniref:SRPBCC family protein n=1 Tax=Lentimicrobium sp. S6 TaxID=2735872 RepID=UPI001557505C|nr:SRPBCC family protein [Lentimicrobium sp. S6]NPD47394.1 hypothetical protein [Lentimicrobium sp. S6]
MHHIKSKTISVSASAPRVYDFISDFNNLEKLMPEKVVDWKSTMTTCTFTIQGMATLNMKQGQNKSNELVQMLADGKNPFQYDLNTFIAAHGEDASEIYLQLNADLNPMLAMMAKKPLENFVNILAEELSKQF